MFKTAAGPTQLSLHLSVLPVQQKDKNNYWNIIFCCLACSTKEFWVCQNVSKCVKDEKVITLTDDGNLKTYEDLSEVCQE